MNAAFNELAEWVTQAGLIGRTESELMAGFCRRIADGGVPLARAIVILDTLHPIYEGRAFRWRADMPEAVEAIDYGRTNEGEAAENLAAQPIFPSAADRAEPECGAVWRPVIRPIFRPLHRPATRALTDYLVLRPSICRRGRHRRDGLRLFSLVQRCAATASARMTSSR